MVYELKVSPRELPLILPSPKFLASCGQNAGAYEPWFWEVEYLSYRYLKSMTLTDLQLRHTQMLNNLSRLAHADRACLPSQFFQSAWYWYRKEHQTRLEFALRGVAPPPDRDSWLVSLDGNDRFSRNEVGDPTLLFRYTKQQYAEAIRDLGVLRVAPAGSYRDMEGDVARADDEMVKTTWLPREHVSARDVTSGNHIKIVSDVRLRHRGADYFVSCFSSAWDIRMFDDFGESTHCVVVRDIEAFAARLAVAGRRHFRGWYFHHAPTMYFDPREWRMDAHMSHATYKDFLFAYQEEYRFLWANHGGQPVDSAQFLELGPLTDIVEVVEKPARAAPHA